MGPTALRHPSLAHPITARQPGQEREREHDDNDDTTTPRRRQCVRDRAVTT